MKTIKFHPQGTAHLYVPFRRLATPCGWHMGTPGGPHESDAPLIEDGEVTCIDCLEHMAAYQQAIGEHPATALYFHTDYGNDDACDTLLAVFTDPADAERECAKLTASIPNYDRSTQSYKTEPCTVLPKGATYNGGRYGD